MTAMAFIRHARAVMKREDEEWAYRHYIARSLQLAPQGMYISRSLRDLLEPIPDFDPDDVIERVMSQF